MHIDSFSFRFCLFFSFCTDVKLIRICMLIVLGRKMKNKLSVKKGVEMACVCVCVCVFVCVCLCVCANACACACAC